MSLLAEFTGHQGRGALEQASSDQETIYYVYDGDTEKQRLFSRDDTAEKAF